MRPFIQPLVSTTCISPPLVLFPDERSISVICRLPEACQSPSDKAFYLAVKDSLSSRIHIFYLSFASVTIIASMLQRTILRNLASDSSGFLAGLFYAGRPYGLISSFIFSRRFLTSLPPSPDLREPFPYWINLR